MSTSGLREDVLVSVCFSDIGANSENLDQLRAVAIQIGKRFRFWEILLVVSTNDTSDFAPLLTSTDNLRILRVRRHAEFYRRRAVAAAEAIGDVVVLASLEDVPYVNLIAMIDTAADTGEMVIARHAAASPRNAVLEPLVRMLGRSAGFRVSAQDMQTMALPRTLLNQLLVRSDRQLALRFPPRDAGMPVRSMLADVSRPDQRSLRDVGRRLTLIQWLLVSSAPRILLYVSFLSLAVTLIGIVYALYALGAWLFLDTLAEGWLTLSLMLSMTATVLGVALLGISLGLQQVLDLLSREVLDDVVDEQGSMDLFSKVASDLNVEVETDASPAPIATEPAAVATSKQVGR